MKKFIFAILAIIMATSFTSCRFVAPDADEEAVLTAHPMIWGHGGVDNDAVETGLKWCWWTTSSNTFKIVPQKHQVNMEDLASDENTPLDFHTVIITQIKKGKTPVLLQNYGTDWFNTNLYNHYCKRVRNHVSKYSPFDLMSNREVLDKIDTKVLEEMQAYVKELSQGAEFPVIIKSVVIGRGIPNAPQLEEMNRTAQEIQAKQTEERRAEAQAARERAEHQRAIADKAYMDEMNLSPAQFVQIKAWDIIREKKGANIDVLFNADGTTKMWNVK